MVSEKEKSVVFSFVCHALNFLSNGQQQILSSYICLFCCFYEKEFVTINFRIRKQSSHFYICVCNNFHNWWRSVTQLHCTFWNLEETLMQVKTQKYILKTSLFSFDFLFRLIHCFNSSSLIIYLSSQLRFFLVI